MLPLMIIDMQTGFLCNANVSLSGVVEQNIRQVRLAKRRNAPVFLVEYGYSGPTVDEIADLLVNYPSVFTVIKHHNDVTSDLPPKVRYLLKKVKKLRVCGVNTNACVESSVTGMHGEFTDLTIQLVRRACGNTWMWDDRGPNGSFRWTRGYKRVKILN